MRGAPCKTSSESRLRFSLGMDIGEFAAHVRVIAINEIIDRAFDRGTRINEDTGVVPRGGRTGKPKEPAWASSKAKEIVRNYAVDNRDVDRRSARRKTSDSNALAIPVRRDMVQSALGRAGPLRGDSNSRTQIIRH